MEELVRVKAYTNENGEHIVCVIIGGLIFVTKAESPEHGFKMGAYTIETLLRFQRSTAVGVVDHAGTVIPKPDDNGGN